MRAVRALSLALRPSPFGKLKKLRMRERQGNAVEAAVSKG